MKNKMQTYKIIRFYESRSRTNKVIKKGLTRKQAQTHCSNPETSGGNEKNSSRWFDGFTKE
tara:strand:- start:2626 stop:2808 length:183 start_codon:yes stop_codon:yes gene_type:complete